MHSNNVQVEPSYKNACTELIAKNGTTEKGNYHKKMTLNMPLAY